MSATNGESSSTSEIVTQEVQSKITSRLQEIFGDDDVSVLTDYICHMINHNQPKEHIVNELKEFLSDEATQFGTWVFQLVNNNSTNVHNNKTSNTNITKNDNNNDDIQKSSNNIVQNKDSLDVAISNAIKSKNGQGRSKTSFQSNVSHRNYYSVTNSDSSSGPMSNTSRQTRINYRNAPYTRSNNYSNLNLTNYNQNQIGVSSTVTSSQAKIKVRCKNWPNCDKGDHCFYIHPSEACKLWPLCPYGPGCFYIHPTVPCRYGLACYNAVCNYTHPVGWDPNYNEVPIFKYGGYKNSSLIINNNKNNKTIENIVDDTSNANNCINDNNMNLDNNPVNNSINEEMKGSETKNNLNIGIESSSGLVNK